MIKKLFVSLGSNIPDLPVAVIVKNEIECVICRAPVLVGVDICHAFFYGNIPVLFIFAELIDIDIRELGAEPCFAFFLIHFKTDYLIDLSFRSYLKQDLTLLGIRDLIVEASLNKIFHLIFVARSKIGNERLRQVVKLSLNLCFF